MVFAVAKVVMADFGDDFQKMLSRLNTNMEKMGLKSHVNKIKIIVFREEVRKQYVTLF